MNLEPRYEADYGPRQIAAARRVLVDIGQVLASYEDCLVLIGGWVPELLITNAEEKHVGSIDVDFALDVEKLASGRYAEMLKVLLDTRRYRQGDKPFQLVTEVDMGDGKASERVDVEFLASQETKLKKNNPKLLPEFRVLRADGCAAAFHAPEQVVVTGRTVLGAKNNVSLQVASLPDFLIMKAFALGGRDKPKDAYDICYCLGNCPGGMAFLARDWKKRGKDKLVSRAITILHDKFKSVDSFGAMQVMMFHDSSNPGERDNHARRAYEVVKTFLKML